MISLRRSVMSLTTIAIVGLGFSAMAQTPPAVSTLQGPPKTIGTARHPHVVPSMIVLNAHGAKIENKKLVLEGVSPNAIVFADRPVRSAGHALTAHLIEEWGDNAPDSFARIPPNATVSVLNKTKASVVDAVVTLRSPRLEGRRLTFDIDILEGDLAGADGAASVFMDIINMPTPRRTSHRSAWYAGAY